jgi:flotillin
MTPDALLLIAAGSPMVGVLVALVAALGIFAFVMWTVLTQFMFIGGPNEVLVLSGRAHVGPDGQRVGYRIVKGGRTLRIPFLEDCKRLSLEPHKIERQLEDLDARDGLIGSLELSAVVKISGEPRRLRNAVERFLGIREEELRSIAASVLEGTLQEVLASQTLDEIADRKHELGDRVADAAADALEALGLELDHLSITKIRASAE